MQDFTHLIQVVDEDDTIIGSKPRNELDFESEIYRSTAIWLMNQKGELLICQRSKHKDKDPGLWADSAGGTLEPGEEYDSNALKECEEEVGVKLDELIDLGKVFLRFPPRNRYTKYYLGYVHDDVEISTQEDEVDNYMWITVDSLESDFTQRPEKYVPTMQQDFKPLKDFLEKSNT